MLNKLCKIIDIIFDNERLNSKQRRDARRDWANMTPEQIEARKQFLETRKSKFVQLHHDAPKKCRQLVTARVAYIQKAGEDIAFKITKKNYVVLRRDGTWSFNE